MPAGHIQTRPSFGFQGKGFSSADDKTLLIMVPVWVFQSDKLSGWTLPKWEFV